MIPLKTLLVVWVTCAMADYVEEREFIPSASMDTEDGWRVMQNPLVNSEELPVQSDPQLYLSFPELDKVSNEIGKDFLNNDEEFRIHVVDSKADHNKVVIQDGDSLPVASSLVAAAPNKFEKKPSKVPINVVKPPKSFYDNTMRKPAPIRNNDVYVPYLPKKLVREPLMERIPYYDMLPENTYKSLSYLEDFLPSYEYKSVPKFLPYRQPPTQDNSVEYYEVDPNARPIILKEEISYEDMPFVPPRFPSMPQKMNFRGASMFPKPYYKGPPVPISVKARRVIRNPKRSVVTFGRSSRGIPIVRGRFRV